MTGRTPSTRGKGKGRGKASSTVVADVYRDMLAEALPTQAEVPERPLKKRRTGRRNGILSNAEKHDVKRNESGDEEDVEFEDVLGEVVSGFAGPSELEQFEYRDSSSDEDSESDFDWNTFNFEPRPPEEPRGDLELTLKSRTPPPKRIITRRKAVTKEERALRSLVHQMHILCLLTYLDARNDWCSDKDTKALLKPLLTKKMITFLRPREDLSQFGRAESLKRGLDDVAKMWRAKFNITERGMRRALWAEDEKDLQNYKLPEDADSVTDKSEFRAAAKTLKGSRDLGAQLFCALLRSAGVKARLVCSLQALSFGPGGPAMPRSSVFSKKVATPEMSDEGEPVNVQAGDFAFGTPGQVPFSARRRLGHPNAASYNLPDMSSSSRPAPPKPKQKTIFESPYPVFWVEVLDEAHQKWFPVDPLVTETISKSYALEPPASDRENAMSYVIAFETGGYARDVTRRYTKAYNSKVRKTRVESLHNGAKWWEKTMEHYARETKSDLEQIEDHELAAFEAREPMPRNVADFKDHPYYALERHLRRNEIIVGIRSVGTVAAGRDTATPGGKKLESVFRRRDVKIVKNADMWYRLGRDIKMGEQPIKVAAPKVNADAGDDDETQPGTNLYTEEQTELYQAPPVVNGRVPKNSFHNLDLFVPSMLPRGGVHIPHDESIRAAQLLGIDYSPALTGFEFHGGRKGTPVLRGVVIAAEYQEAIEAVIEGYQDERAQAEENRRSIAALRMWKRFLVSLRIRKRVDGYEVDGERDDAGVVQHAEEEDESEEYDPDEDMGGGFLPD